MNTRNIIVALATLPIVAGFESCKSDEELDAKPAKEILKVEGGGVELRAGDETTNVTIVADCPWEVMPYKGGDFGNKLSVQPLKGNGNGVLVITVDQNTTLTERRDTIVLKSDGGLLQRIPIRQTSGDDALTLSKQSFSFGANDETAQLLTINCNSPWTIQIPAGVNWLHLDKTKGGAGADVVQLTADAAASDVERSATLAVLYGSKSAEVTVTQEGITDIFLHVSEESNRFEARGGEYMLRIESNAEWHAYIPSSVTWLHLESMNGQRISDHEAVGFGNGELRVMCNENTLDRDRLSALIIIAGAKSPKQAVVIMEQAGNSNQPVEDYYLTISDIGSFYVHDTNAEVYFNFQSNPEAEEFGVVISMVNDHPTVNGENSQTLVIGHGERGGQVIVPLNNLEPGTTYYVRAFVSLSQLGVRYSPNVLTITTEGGQREPDENDNPDPTLSRKQ